MRVESCTARFARLRRVADHVLLGEESLNYQSMTTISKEKKLITLINLFTVDPAKQQQLVDLLIQATESSIRHIPGFISASLHRSLDGAKVAMYAQWRSVEDYQAMRKNAAALPYMEQASLSQSSSPECMRLSRLLSTFQHIPNQAMQPTR
jgi:quinol monooxygenase YgiN